MKNRYTGTRSENQKGFDYRNRRFTLIIKMDRVFERTSKVLKYINFVNLVGYYVSSTGHW